MTTPIKSSELLRAAGFRFQAARFAGECAACCATRPADNLRVVTGGTISFAGALHQVTRWVAVCKRQQCTTAYLAGLSCQPVAGTAPVALVATHGGCDALDSDDIAARALGLAD